MLNPAIQRTTRLVAFLVVLAAAASCAPAGQPDVAGEAGSTAIGTIVEAAWRKHIDAAKRNDLEAVLEIYTEDIVYVIPGQTEVRGLEAVREMETQTLAAADVLDAVHTSDSVHVHDDVAYEVGTVVGPVRIGDAPASVVQYHFMAMWQLGADDKWRIRHIVGQAPPGDEREPADR